MFSKIKSLASQAKDKAVFALAPAVALGTSALTMSGGKVTFEQADKDAMDSGVGNAVSNLWGGFTFSLDYLGTYVGIALVIGTIGFLIFRRKG